MLDQYDAGGLSWLAAADSHRESSQLKTLRINIAPGAILSFNVDLPRLPIIPGGSAPVHLHAGREHDALRLSVSGKIGVGALLVVPACFSGNGGRNG
jgi:hypothetical protein